MAQESLLPLRPRQITRWGRWRARRAVRRAIRALPAGLRLMYDAIPPSSQIPADAQMVAGYIDGLYAWSAADWARFPNAVKVRIAVRSTTNDGDVLDVEPASSVTPYESGKILSWVRMRRAAGAHPTIYVSLAFWSMVRGYFTAAGEPEPEWWIAAYPGIGQALYDGAVAHQYADLGPYDLSVVAPFWAGVDNGVAPTPPPAPKEEEVKGFIARGAASDPAAWWFCRGYVRSHITDPQTANVLAVTGQSGNGVGANGDVAQLSNDVFNQYVPVEKHGGGGSGVKGFIAADPGNAWWFCRDGVRSYIADGHTADVLAFIGQSGNGASGVTQLSQDVFDQYVTIDKLAAGQGSPGPAGPAGPAGPPGPTGPSGPPGVPAGAAIAGTFTGKVQA